MGAARRALLVVVACIALGGCGPIVFLLGDSQSHNAHSDLHGAHNPDYSLRVTAKPACGLLPNEHALCPGPVDWKAELDALTAQHGTPEVVVVELGVNDALNYTAEELAQLEPDAIRAFVADVPAGIPVVWANVPYSAPTWDPTADERAQVVNAALAQIDEELEQLTVVDLRSHFDGHWPEWYVSDGLHYNAIGNREYAQFMCRSLDPLALTESPAECDATT